MILQGDLKDFSLPDALQLLLQQKKTGVLALTRDKEQSELFISQGNIVGVRVGARTPENKIQEILMASGLVSPKDMGELEAMSRDMGRPLLSTLTAKGLLHDAQRESWFQMAAEDMVCDLFAWTEGQYSFSTSQKSLPQALGTLRLSTEFACMEGMRRIDEWPHLKETLPFEGAVFQPTGNLPTEEMGDWETLVLQSINGQRTLGQLERMVPFGSFRLYECLVNLWKSDFIAPVDAASIQAAATLPIAQQSERDQKTALVVGVAAMLLVGAALFRFVGHWMWAPDGARTQSVETRVRADLSARNTAVFLIRDASTRGHYANSLKDLVRRGVLTDFEAYGPRDARLHYQKHGSSDFELR